MRAARNTIGNYCYKKSCSYILNKCQWLSIEKMVSYSGICFIYKIIANKEPNSMLSMFKTKKSKRNISKWYTAYQPKTKLMQNFIIYKSLANIYSLPKDIQNCKQSTFKSRLKKYLMSLFRKLFLWCIHD